MKPNLRSILLLALIPLGLSAQTNNADEILGANHGALLLGYSARMYDGYLGGIAGYYARGRWGGFVMFNLETKIHQSDLNFMNGVASLSYSYRQFSNGDGHDNFNIGIIRGLFDNIDLMAALGKVRNKAFLKTDDGFVYSYRSNGSFYQVHHPGALTLRNEKNDSWEDSFLLGLMIHSGIKVNIFAGYIFTPDRLVVGGSYLLTIF